MYLDEAVVVYPPEGGWPSITKEVLPKADEVIALLRQLPYITMDENWEQSEASAWCIFANWAKSCDELRSGRDGIDWEGEKLLSEGPDWYEHVPPHVVSLTRGSHVNPKFFLDTEQGVIYWPECFTDIRWPPGRDTVREDLVEHDPSDYAPEEEEDWRGEPAWAVADFFEMLKDQFRELHFVPVNPRRVRMESDGAASGIEGLVPMVQDIYREHGWPDLERYKKNECLEAIRQALEERYPDYYV